MPTHVPCGTKTTESTSIESMTPGKETMKVKVLLITSERGINYTLLQNNGSLEWKIHRLLWMGYLKNVNNETCYLSKVPKDIIKYIIKFFRIFDIKRPVLPNEKMTWFLS